MPKMRLDFIFSSSNLLYNEKQFYLKKQQNKVDLNTFNRLIAAGIEKSDLTSKLSDHFPVYLSWYEENDPFGN